MSATPTFQTDLYNQLVNQTSTESFFLTPINQIRVFDTNGNLMETITDVTITYSNGKLTVKAEFQAENTFTVGTIQIGSYNNGVFKPYFCCKKLSGTKITAGNFYCICSVICLNNFTLNLSPFNTASLNALKLANIIGGILSGNPSYAGKSGAYFIAIYVVNTTSNVNMSYRIPVTIMDLSSGVLIVGGIVPSPIEGNIVEVRDSSGASLIKVSSTEVVTFKKGRQIIFELTLQGT